MSNYSYNYSLLHWLRNQTMLPFYECVAILRFEPLLGVIFPYMKHTLRNNWLTFTICLLLDDYCMKFLICHDILEMACLLYISTKHYDRLCKKRVCISDCTASHRRVCLQHRIWKGQLKAGITAGHKTMTKRLGQKAPSHTSCNNNAFNMPLFCKAPSTILYTTSGLFSEL